MSGPRITIITITFNAELYLEQTIASVIGQTYNDKEYIVIDGGSTDSSLDIIKKYKKNIDKWISEPDNGISHAMNKGLQYATGDFVFFLHSDDYLCDDNVLAEACQFLTDQHDLYLFPIFLASEDGRKQLHYPRGFNWWMNFKTGVFHQSAICSRKLFRQIGNFDTQFKIAMDYDFFLRAYKEKVRARFINFPFSVMRLVGVSSQTDRKSLYNRFEEEQIIHRLNNPGRVWTFIYLVYWFFYKLYRVSRDYYRYHRS